uniref:Uncharacterized protein n=1 Tax=viral metagenome TaxID=1070528 RepID=A0A6M3JR52_9ZZZZ
MSIELARGRAAQAWCTSKTSKKVMDVELAEAFANILNEVWSKPWLGNATTEELIDELRARCEINGTLSYKTVGE